MKIVANNKTKKQFSSKAGLL